VEGDIREISDSSFHSRGHGTFPSPCWGHCEWVVLMRVLCMTRTKRHHGIEIFDQNTDFGQELQFHASSNKVMTF